MVGTLAVALSLPVTLAAQSSPDHLVSDAYRTEFALNALRIIAAADDMPAGRYRFRPTRGQMSFAEVVIHVLQGNDDIAAAVGDTLAPRRTPVTAADSKMVLVTRLKETFAFCTAALARLHDSMLGDALPDYGTRAQALFNTINHWSDHYSQMAIYLRLNGVLPPTARHPQPLQAATRPDSSERRLRCDSRRPILPGDHAGTIGTTQIDLPGCHQ